jgi:inorganic pyrophosphatase
MIAGDAKHREGEERFVEAVIEDPRGSTTRHHFDTDRRVWVEAPHPHSSTPWPASYGYLPGTFNPADDDALDTLVLATNPLRTGTRLAIRPVGLLIRPDGDHKILAVAAGDPTYGNIMRLETVPPQDIERIEAWFAEWSRVGHWRDERAAWQQIADLSENDSERV